MIVKYFEYNNNQNGEKYMEVTKEDFQKDVIETEGRFYISFGTSVMECEEHEHKKDKKEKEHSEYISKDASGKKPTILSLDDYKLKTGIDITEVIEDTTVNVEDECYKKYQYELLYAALAQLDQDELELVNLLYWDELSQNKVGELYGKTQQNISWMNRGVLDKLTNLMSFKK